MLPDRESAAGGEGLNPVEMPLVPGITLIEASAGTGKTYAIAMLVLRAVVELAVPIEQILIVTYTRAATEELQGRVRARLLAARALLEGLPVEAGSVDSTLQNWLERLEEPAAARHRLRQALADIDRAPIHTIHGFCQRVLVDQALETGQLFDCDLQADVAAIRLQVVEDFWRQRVYPLAPLPAAFFTTDFATPEKLLASVNAVFGEDAEIVPEVPTVAAAADALEATMATLRRWWSADGAAVAELFRRGFADHAFKKNLHEAGEGWLTDLADLLSEEMAVVPAGLDWLTREGLIAELNGRTFRGQAAKEAYLHGWPLADQEMPAVKSAAATLTLALRVELARQLRLAVSKRLEAQGRFGFDELVLQLAAVLQGAGRNSLRQSVAGRYRLALVDEFQDTDSAQWQIFSTLFSASHHQLYLIGDPKQAIYRFRGADISSYFTARQAAARRLALNRNYRSHPALVEAVNQLFSQRERPFLLSEEILPYQPVVAAKAAAECDLQSAGQSLAGLVCCQLAPCLEDSNGRWSSGRAAEHLCRFTVVEILRLLDRENPVRLHQGIATRQLAPHDIAILVRSHAQADSYRQALAEVGIPSVVASRHSVYRSEECRELLILLTAVLNPGDGRRLRSALTVSWFALDGPALHRLSVDDAAFGHYQERFSNYARIWQEQGFLTMMVQLLEQEQVLENLAARRFAERRITNIHQLLELVQEQESSLGGAATLHWLQQTRQNGGAGEEAELQLESDAEAVRIVTMHAAKGLEYHVVFCPLLWYRSDHSGAAQQLRCRENGRSLVDLGSPHFTLRLGQLAMEEKAEEQRLLYVAVTRAKIRCYLMWADVKAWGKVVDSFSSALGYLLFANGSVAADEQRDVLAEMAGEQRYRLVATPVEVVGRFVPLAGEEELSSRPYPTRSLQSDWQVTSYTALAHLTADGTGMGEAEDGEEMAGLEEGEIVPDIPESGLPAGAHFGNLIHGMLEECPFAGLAAGEGCTAEFFQLSRRYAVAADHSAVMQLLQRVVRTPLPPPPCPGSGAPFQLAQLSPDQCIREMVYTFRLASLDTRQISAILAGEQTVAPLAFRSLRGFLTGVVDLLCLHDGKYYILDYKSNYLDTAATAYAPERLAGVMREHNYGLQYWLYTLVADRYLRNLLPDYQYSRDFGGVYYLFVRGMGQPGQGVYATWPDPDTLARLGRLLAGEGR